MRHNSKISTNRVIDRFKKKVVRLTVNKLDKTTILIEGEPIALEFLGQLCLAVAKSEEHSIHISPRGAGGVYFTKKSTLGLYIHKLPCKNQKPSKPNPPRKSRDLRNQ